MKTIAVPLSDELKRKLDVMRTRGYTMNGFVRQALETALADVHPNGHVTIRYRKPGGHWATRAVPAALVEKTILRLEDQGAEILRSV